MSTLIPKFEQTGSTTINRPINLKLQEFVSVKDFGATGDGTTDDSAAIQAAINAVISAQSTNPPTGMNPASIYFPAGSYKISTTIDATGILLLFGNSRGSAKILSYVTPTFNCGQSTSFLNLFFSKQTGGSTALTYASGAYLAQIDNCGFTSYTIGIDFQGSYGTTKTLVQQCSFDSNTTAIKVQGTSTTLSVKNNQFNTGTTAINCANCFNFEITGNNFEDYTTPIIINTQLVNSLISANWFEKAAAGSVTPFTDNTASPGYFTINTFVGNRFVSTNTPNYGTASLIFDNGILQINPASLSNPASGIKYTVSSITPLSANAAASTSPFDYTITTQNAVASQTSRGGDFIFDLGTGSNGQPYGSPRPKTDNTSNLGSASYRWATVYAATGTINTSDANQKTDIVDISDVEKRVAVKLKSSIKRFKFINGKRYHFGTIAQDVKTAFESEGLKAEEYGLFCSDTWYTDQNGDVYESNLDSKNTLIPNLTTHTQLGIRYDELFAFIISAL